MKALLFVLVIVSVVILFPAKTYGLDYEIKGLDECLKQSIKTPECARKICVRDNLERNWPVDTGYYENCERKKYIYVSAYALGGTGLLAVTAIILKRKLKK